MISFILFVCFALMGVLTLANYKTFSLVCFVSAVVCLMATIRQENEK